MPCIFERYHTQVGNRPRLVPLSCPQTHSTPSGAPDPHSSALCREMGSLALSSTLRIGPVAGSTKKIKIYQNTIFWRRKKKKDVINSSAGVIQIKNHCFKTSPESVILRCNLNAKWHPLSSLASKMVGSWYWWRKLYLPAWGSHPLHSVGWEKNQALYLKVKNLH